MPLDKEMVELMDQVINSLIAATDRLEKMQEQVGRVAATLAFLAGQNQGLIDRMDRLEGQYAEDNEATSSGQDF